MESLQRVRYLLDGVTATHLVSIFCNINGLSPQDGKLQTTITSFTIEDDEESVSVELRSKSRLICMLYAESNTLHDAYLELPEKFVSMFYEVGKYLGGKIDHMQIDLEGKPWVENLERALGNIDLTTYDYEKPFIGSVKELSNKLNQLLFVTDR